jgi:hypothetical protein
MSCEIRDGAGAVRAKWTQRASMGEGDKRMLKHDLYAGDLQPVGDVIHHPALGPMS